jgi:hypothetical protein
MKIVTMLLLCISLIATILLLLAIKILRKIYIRKAKEEIVKIKGKEQVILYKVRDDIENRLFELNKCTLVVKGFEEVCDTLRRHWSLEDKLKLTYKFKNDFNINIELFFDNNGSWKKIDGLYNLSDGINDLNCYEIIFKVNKKIKELLETLIICDIALWLGIISLHCIFLFLGV